RETVGEVVDLHRLVAESERGGGRGDGLVGFLHLLSAPVSFGPWDDVPTLIIQSSTLCCQAFAACASVRTINLPGTKKRRRRARAAGLEEAAENREGDEGRVDRDATGRQRLLVGGVEDLLQLQVGSARLEPESIGRPGALAAAREARLERRQSV